MARARQVKDNALLLALLPLGLWAVTRTADVILSRPLNRVWTGVVDEIAHLATTSLLLLGIAGAYGLTRHTHPWRSATFRAFAVAAVLAGNLIDLDHLPGEFGHQWVTEGTPRPYSHSVLTVLVLLLLAVPQHSRRVWSIGAAYGVSGHLLRDLTGGGYVSLWWPLTNAAVAWPRGAGTAVFAIATLLWLLWLVRRQSRNG